MAQLLTDTEIQDHLRQLPNWVLHGNEIQLTRKFKDFLGAIDFVNRLVDPAETAGHHPDIAISYNKVIVSLTTHDIGGLTQKDFEMAKLVSSIS